MKTKRHIQFGPALLVGIMGVAGCLAASAEEAKPVPPPEALGSAQKSPEKKDSKPAGEIKARAESSAKAGADGGVSINVTVTGPDGKPLSKKVGDVVTTQGSTRVELQGSAIAVSSEGGKSSVTVTTIGPDGKVHTVTHGGPAGKPAPIPLPAPFKMERVPYVGVNAAEVPEVVGKHLPIPKGMGLVVTEVVKGSPAEKAGILKDDILLKFDDQVLATQEQLRKLVRSRSSGDKVRLALMHGGRETTVEVVLSEREEDVANPGHAPGMPGWLQDGTGPGGHSVREAVERARKVAEEMARNSRERMEKGGTSSDTAAQEGALVRRIELLEREISRLKEEVERRRGQGARRSAEGEAGGERVPRGAREGEKR